MFIVAAAVGCSWLGFSNINKIKKNLCYYFKNVCHPTKVIIYYKLSSGNKNDLIFYKLLGEERTTSQIALT